MSVNGVKEIQAAFNLKRKTHAKGLRIGLLRAGLYLQRESQKLVPIATGALRASAGTRVEGVGFDTAVVVSYGTLYGLYVHENLDAKHMPGRQAKFLEQPLREGRDHLKAIIVKAVESTKY